MNPRHSKAFSSALGLAVALVLAVPTAGWAQHAAVTSPHGKLPAGLSCSDCHTPRGWRPTRKNMHFNHAAVAGVRLTGRHTTVACAACHLDLRFDRPRMAMSHCGSCHVDVHQGRMPGTCSDCHNTTSFRMAASVAAHARTNFPLTGMHARLPCDACHRNDRGGAFTSLPTDCYACHAPDYRNARLVNHVTRQFPTVCQQCHTTSSWQGATFDHSTVGFALVGAHAMLPCTSCHVPPDNHLIATPSGQNDCVACHQTDYNHAHGGSGFPTTCTTCHTASSWSGVTFDHSSVGFPLTGAHVKLACSSCHVPPDFHLIATPSGPNDCVACHQADYNKEHAGSGYPTTCTTCHTTSSWSGATFDHSSVGFPLTGAHATLACTSCHIPPDNHLIATPSGPNDCVACHQADYTKAHGGSGFPTTCSMCHTTSSWSGSSFNHDQQYFPIYSGSHAGRWTSCTQCHTNPSDFSVFSCLTCHLKTQTDQNHSGVSGYVYDSAHCLACHPTGNGGG